MPMARGLEASASRTATLRWEEENSSAKIFIGDAAFKFADRLHFDEAVTAFGFLLEPAELRPAICPFEDSHPDALIKVLVQARATNGCFIFETIKVQMIE